MVDELLLQRVQHLFATGVVAGQSLDRADRLALRLESGVNAGIHRRAIHVHRANPAFGFVAADLGPGQTKIVAQHSGQRARFRHIQVTFDAVYSQRQSGHRLLSMPKLAKSYAFCTRNLAARTFDGQRQNLIEKGFDHVRTVLRTGSILAGARMQLVAGACSHSTQ